MEKAETPATPASAEKPATVELPAPPHGFCYKLVPSNEIPGFLSTTEGATAGRSSEGRPVTVVTAGSTTIETFTELEVPPRPDEDNIGWPEGSRRATIGDDDPRRWSRLERRR